MSAAETDEAGWTDERNHAGALLAHGRGGWLVPPTEIDFELFRTLMQAEVEFGRGQFAALELALPFITFGGDDELMPVLPSEEVQMLQVARAFCRIGWLDDAPDPEDDTHLAPADD